MRNIRLWGVLALISLHAFPAQAKVVERVVARVNDEVITLSEYKAEVASLRVVIEKEMPPGKERDEAFAKRKDDVLEGLIRDKLLYQRSKEYGLCNNVETEVSAHVEQIKKQYNMTTEQLEQELAREGLSLQAYRENIARRACINRLIQQFVYSKMAVTGEEIEKFYKENPDQFTKPAEADFSEIVFYTEGKDPAQVEAGARQVLEALKKGEDFAELAKKHSEGPTKESGGAIGSFKPGMLEADVEKVAFALNAGESTKDLIRTKFGFQVLKATRKQEAEKIPLAEVRTRIHEYLMMKKTQPAIDQFVKKLKEESFIHIVPNAVE